MTGWHLERWHKKQTISEQQYHVISLFFKDNKYVVCLFWGYDHQSAGEWTKASEVLVMNRASRCSWWTSSALWGRWWEVSVLSPLNSLMSRLVKPPLLTCCVLSVCPSSSAAHCSQLCLHRAAASVWMKRSKVKIMGQTSGLFCRNTSLSVTHRAHMWSFKLVISSFSEQSRSLFCGDVRRTAQQLTCHLVLVEMFVRKSKVFTIFRNKNE